MIVLLGQMLLFFLNQGACNGAKIEFFEMADFRGDLIFEAESAKYCREVDGTSFVLNGSVKTSGCIAVFNKKRCVQYGTRIQSEEKDLSQWHGIRFDTDEEHNHVASFRDCTKLERSPQTIIDIFGLNGLDQYWEIDNETRGRYRNICSCANFISDNESYAVHGNAHGNCFNLYETQNCVGAPTKTIHQLGFSVVLTSGSIAPCIFSLFCSSLKVSVLYMKPDLKDSNFVGSPRDFSMSIKQTYVNKGPVKMKVKYEAIKNVTQEAEFSFAQSLQEIASYLSNFEMSEENSTETKNETGYEVNVGFSVKIGIFSIGASAGYSDKSTNTVKSTLTSAFVSSTGEKSEVISNKKLKNTVKTTKTFNESQTIIIPPCTKYQATSVVRMAEDVNISYFVYLAISGQSVKGNQLNRTEIRKILEWNQSQDKLSILENHDQEGDFKLVAVTKAALRASYGLNSEMIGGGEDIPSCLIQQNQLECE